MSQVVLRHKDLPDQPIVVPVGPDGLVSVAYKTAGWEIDAKTDPADAELESPKPKKRTAPKPSFEEPVTDQPAEPVNPKE